MGDTHAEQSFTARAVRRLSVPIILFWFAVVVVANLAVPQLEIVEREHSVSSTPKDAPSINALKRIGEVFHEFDSDSVAMIVLEGDKPLADDAHHYYDDLIRQLSSDTKHVQHIQDFWGDPLTAAAAQSPDGTAAYVQLTLAGSLGETLSNKSVTAVRDVVARTPPPAGIKTYVTGLAPLVADEFDSGDKSTVKMAASSIVVITITLLVVYRSVVTVILLLATVGVELAAARGVVAILGHHGLVGLSTFAVSLLTSLALAAGTDYGIFFIGRYQEARQAGQDPNTAYYTTFRGITPVVLGSGLTIAGAIACLSFTRMPYLQTMGLPAATGLIVTVAAAATLGPAVLAVASRAGLFEAKRRVKTRGWRRIGTAVVRWPGPILVATSMVTLVGLLALPGYKTSYDDRRYMPGDIPANIGYQAAARHFSQSRLNPDALLIETDHDMRNPTDMLVLDKVAKNIFHVPGVARVQAITRPSGTPIEHSSIPSQISIQNAVIIQNMQYLKDRLTDMRQMGDELTRLIDTMRSTQDVMEDFSYSTDHLVDDMNQIRATTERIRDGIGDFDDAFRPIRNYFYWEPHCVNIPVCSAIRSAYSALDGVDQLAESAQNTTSDVNDLKSTVPKIVAQLSPIIATLTDVQTAVLTMHSTFSGLIAQIDAFTDGATAMGQAFDGANNDDSFYLPPEVFQNPEFEAGLTVFLSPDGKATRLMIVHQNDPSSPEAVANVDAIKKVAFESIKGTPQEGANIQIGGTAAIYKDLQQGSRYDLLIAAVAALSLVFIIMLIVTRSLVAASAIVGTVALSLGSSFGLAVLLWQRILGIELHYLVLAMAVIVLLAVGSDYNLLLVSRFKEELGAGLNTGTIRSMGGTGKVVTTAGLVFAFTMGSMIVSDLLVIGQVGTTICIGLLFDTLIVRSFLMPSIAMLLGRWFWWPQNVHPRPARNLSAGKVLAYRA